MTARLATHPDVAYRWPAVRDGLRAADMDVGQQPVVVDSLRPMFPTGADLMMVGLGALRRPEAEGLFTVAVPPRRDARDVLVTARPGSSLRSLRAGARVGVEGARRRAFLAAHRQDLIAVPVTSPQAVAEVSAGRLDAAVVAVDVARTLDVRDLGMEILDPRAWLPEPGQGIVALVSRRPLAVAAALEHAPTRTALRAELALLHALGVPDEPTTRAVDGAVTRVFDGSAIGSVAQATGRSVRLWATVASRDGRRLVRADVTGALDEPEALGGTVARLLFDRGAAELLGSPGR